MKWWKRRTAPGAAGHEANAPTQSLVVADTGDAHAQDGGMAVTGYRSPVPEANTSTASVQVTGTGDATASGSALAISGYVHELTIGRLTMVHPGAPREPATWPHQVGVVPPRAQSFQHRAEIQALRAAADGKDSAVPCQVLTGMGGVGKTQLAADYAHTAWQSDGLDVLVWITASTRSAAVTGYAQAGVELCRADPTDPEQAARAFLAWLQPKAGQGRPCRWLVVLDDIADPADLRGLWPPTSPHGHTLATTRRRDAALTGTGRRLVAVGLFTEAEAAAYLTAALAAHGRHELPEELTSLACDLGHLPLALSQAAAYLTDSGLNAASYRRLLADRARQLALLLPDPGVLPDDQAVPVAAAWSLSLERANTLHPLGLARPMLQLVAMLSPNGIPHAVLTSQPALDHLDAQRPTDTGSAHRPGQVSAEDAVRTLRTLHRLSLIDHTPDTPHQAVRLHQLIQRATRDTLTANEHDRTARTAADALTAAWPARQDDNPLTQALRANTTALTYTSEDALYRFGAHAVLFRTGESLGRSGQVAAALNHFQHLAATSHQRHGPDHPDTLAARHRLASWQGESGNAPGAAAEHEKLLADMKRVLGPDHPDTLATWREHSYWRGLAGDAPGAVAALARQLTIETRVLGPNHLSTFFTRENLAELGGTAHIVAVYEQLLADQLRVLGPHHPDTLTTRRDLASCRRWAGDEADAQAMYEQLLADQTRVLGPHHPDTHSTRDELASYRGRAGDAAGAVAAFEQLLADRRRVLGPDHRDTHAARHQLAFWRWAAGDGVGAVAVYEQLLDERLRVLGPDHPDTLTTRRDLARYRGRTGNRANAVAAFEQLLADQTRVLGPDHRDTLATRDHIAFWRGRAGDAAGAVAMYEQLLADRERLLGPDHRDTLITWGHLTVWRARVGKRSPRTRLRHALRLLRRSG